MKAPDKIYLRCARHNKKQTSWFWYEIQCYPNQPKIEQEYIRKDVLEEWARENFETCKTIGTRAMQKAFEELIDRIKSL